jgi:Mg2+/Co2+ transporter CorC
MTEAGHVLRPNEVVEHNGLVFQIERVERRRVIRVRLLIRDEKEMAAADAETDKLSAAR